MADEEKGADSHSSAGNDWELVSLTASTYAAAPGPILPPLETDKRGVGYFDPKYDSPAAMFMSGHVSLPMEGHVDLLKQSDCKGETDEVCDKEFSPAMMGDDPHDLSRSYAKAKSCESKLDDDLPGFNLLDNQKSVSLDDVVFGDAKGLGGLSLAGEEERNMFCSSGFDTPDAGSDIFRSAHRAANAATAGIVDPACATGDDPVDSVVISGVAYIAKGQSKIPCEAWWKKTFSSLCNNSKESVTFRFIIVAATIVGLAILGQHWQREKLQRQQFRLQFNVNSEKMGCSVGGPLGQVKGSRVLSPRGMYDALGS